MYTLVKTRRLLEMSETLASLDRSHAVIEFALDGTVLTANGNFLSLLGYTLGEIQGRHHSLFVDPAYRDSAEYRKFWDDLRAGIYQAAQFKRIGKGGREVWIEASYNPILDRDGKPFKVVKYATDVTAQKMRYADLQGQVDAINKSQAVIEFALDGTVLTANANFLAAMGYTLGEIQGRHHSLFVDPAYRDSAEYRKFWDDLRAGTYQAAQFKRIGKGGREVWIEASYNPILDLNGRPFKVVKYATDVTRQVRILADLKTLIDHNFGEIDGAVAETTRRSDGAVHEYVGSTAAAVEQQSAVTRDMSDNMKKTADAVEMVTHNLTQIATANRQVGSAVEKTKEAALVLAH